MSKKRDNKASIQLIEDENLMLDDNDVNARNDELRDVCDYFGTYRISSLIIGASGSGKTTWLLNFITNGRRTYDIYILILPKESTLGGLYKIFMKDHPKNAFVFILGEETLPTVSELTELKQQKGKIAVILDDWTSTKNKNDLRQIYAYFTQISRASADFYCLVQDYQAVPSSIRQNANIIVMFVGAISKSGYATIFREWYKSQFLEKSERDRLLRLFGPVKYKPLILINNVPAEKSMIFDDSYVVIDNGYSDSSDEECDDETPEIFEYNSESEEELTREGIMELLKKFEK